MVDVKSKRCEHDGCSRQPTFDAPGGKGRFCAAHKDPGMVDVKTKRCERDGCEILNPVFDAPGGKGRFCAAHKDPGMQNVKSKRCEQDGCSTRARYGLPGHAPSMCARHRDKGRMVRHPTRRCSKRGCAELATHAQIGCMPSFCEAHVPTGEDAIEWCNIFEQPCASCGLEMILNRRGVCATCDPASFRRAYLAKQNQLEDHLRTNAAWLFELPNDVDRVIDGGVCGKERPDFWFDMGDRVLVIECDENQHRERACECEMARMVNVAQSFGGRKVIFLRYNPDLYVLPNGEAGRESRWKRMEAVCEMAQYVATSWDPPLEPLAFCVYLFYDGPQTREIVPVL